MFLEFSELHLNKSLTWGKKNTFLASVGSWKIMYDILISVVKNGNLEGGKMESGSFLPVQKMYRKVFFQCMETKFFLGTHTSWEKTAMKQMSFKVYFEIWWEYRWVLKPSTGKHSLSVQFCWPISVDTDVCTYVTKGIM